MVRVSVLASGAVAVAASLAEARIYAAVLFQRHGDRTPKFAGSTRMTQLGQNQVFNAGSFFRERYLSPSSETFIDGISIDVPNYKQISAYSPDEAVLAVTGQAFLQGLYPPIGSESAAKGLSHAIIHDAETPETVISPLNGYQYSFLHTVPADFSEAIWLKGDDQCKALDTEIKEYFRSSSFKELQQESKDFYDSVKQYFSEYPDFDVSAKNAFNVFDALQYFERYDSSVNIPSETILKAKEYAARVESASYTANSISNLATAAPGRTLAHRVLTELSKNIASEGTSNKLTLLTGSYDTFLSFFGITGVANMAPNFSDLPDFASTLIFELYSSSESNAYPSKSDLRVRFLFRNGTAEPQEVPLFNYSPSFLALEDNVKKVGIKDVTQWCDVCQSDAPFCALVKANKEDKTLSWDEIADEYRMNPIVAGVIGALVTMIVMALGFTTAMFVGGLRVVKRVRNGQQYPTGKTLSRSSSFATVEEEVNVVSKA